ncbi:crotonobetaine/carnitine-CoA ligase [Klebsiella pneumoniae]|uniref:Crotonobetaine/carnitine-CoA ligase n=1 Tax=Klebsiella pneumoniae TaxID=573 RepID=A0A2X3F9Q6_KLEPN|nr:crotonobetaine/carnitine-CoA ligase [Klebsiella pneumoniae]
MLSGWHRRWRRWGCRRAPAAPTLAWNNRRHLEIYFAVASGGWVTHTVNPRLSVDHLRYILNDAADEVLFF